MIHIPDSIVVDSRTLLLVLGHAEYEYEYEHRFNEHKHETQVNMWGITRGYAQRFTTIRFLTEPRSTQRPVAIPLAMLGRTSIFAVAQREPAVGIRRW